MKAQLIHDRGRGPEIVGTRITVYNLLPHFIDATATEAYICSLYDLTPEQVAAARAFVLNNPETVLAEHLRVESRMAAGNSPEVIEQAKRTHSTFLQFKEWLSQREQAGAHGRAAQSTAERDPAKSDEFPSFREWLAEHESRPQTGS